MDESKGTCDYDDTWHGNVAAVACMLSPNDEQVCAMKPVKKGEAKLLFMVHHHNNGSTKVTAQTSCGGDGDFLE